jgi:hypothetical protein
MRGKPMSEKGKNTAELAGLGILAAPSVVAIGKGLKDKVPSLAKMFARR